MKSCAREVFVAGLKYDERSSKYEILDDDAIEEFEEAENISGIISIKETLEKCIKELVGENSKCYVMHPYSDSDDYHSIENITPREELAIYNLLKRYKSRKVQIDIDGCTVRIELNYEVDRQRREHYPNITITCEQQKTFDFQSSGEQFELENN